MDYHLKGPSGLRLRGVCVYVYICVCVHFYDDRGFGFQARFRIPSTSSNTQARLPLVEDMGTPGLLTYSSQSVAKHPTALTIPNGSHLEPWLTSQQSFAHASLPRL